MRSTLERRLRALENRIKNESLEDAEAEVSHFLADLARLMDKYPNVQISGWDDDTQIVFSEDMNEPYVVATVSTLTADTVRAEAIPAARKSNRWKRVDPVYGI